MIVHAFTIPVEPKAQMRARSSLIKTKDGRQFIHHRKHKKQELAEDNFRPFLYEYRPEALILGPIVLHFIAHMPRSKSHYGTGKNTNKLKPSAPLFHTKTPDIDNLAKFLEDCMQGVFFKNDSQIVALHGRKQYSDRPRWEIKIYEMEG